jgi:hypothetical protein
VFPYTTIRPERSANLRYSSLNSSRVISPSSSRPPLINPPWTPALDEDNLASCPHHPLKPLSLSRWSRLPPPPEFGSQREQISYLLPDPLFLSVRRLEQRKDSASPPLPGLWIRPDPLRREGVTTRVLLMFHRRWGGSGTGGSESGLGLGFSIDARRRETGTHTHVETYYRICRGALGSR